MLIFYDAAFGLMGNSLPPVISSCIWYG